MLDWFLIYSYNQSRHRIMSFSPQLNINLSLPKVIKLVWSYPIAQRAIFFIERSINNVDFEKIGLLNTQPKNIYEFSDFFPTKGRNYYRLVEIDAIGNAMISPVEEICIMF